MAKYGSKRIGILGGTFDPVHNGHLLMARRALKELRLDRVIFVPARIPPHKKIQGGVTAQDRLRMLLLATSGKKKFEVSRCELKRKGPSYSVRTAAHLAKKYGKNTKLFFLIGADSVSGLSKWKKIAALRKIVRFAAAPRAGYKINPGTPGIIKLNMPKKNVSSTVIRRLVKKKKGVKRFVPAEIERYIKRRNLYG